MSRLEDRQAITDVLYRYARAVDRLDLDGVQDCYFPEAIDNHGAYCGPVEGLVEDIRRRHTTIDSSQHYITNVLIEFCGEDAAAVESYCLCYLRQEPEDGRLGQELAIIRCRYVDRFERRQGHWRIADRTVVFDEYRRERVTDSVDPSWVRSQRNRSDPVHLTSQLSNP
jgi:3-phenylpropionate/cinnamic acid dioxygenase small subunit